MKCTSHIEATIENILEEIEDEGLEVKQDQAFVRD